MSRSCRALIEAGAGRGRRRRWPRSTRSPRPPGPGLIGGVMVGLVTAKGLALAAGKPLVAVNHLEGHALSPRLSRSGPRFPLSAAARLGRPLPVAARSRASAATAASPPRSTTPPARRSTRPPSCSASAFPAGRRSSAAAEAGDPRAVPLPRPLVGSDEPHFSFAGLKSAVLRAQRERALHADADIAASFQQAVVDCLVDRTRARARRGAGRDRAGRRRRRRRQPGGPRRARPGSPRAHGLPFVAPPLWLCTDNAAMIAWAGRAALRGRADRRPRRAGAGALAARSGGREGARRGGEGMRIGVVGARRLGHRARPGRGGRRRGGAALGARARGGRGDQRTPREQRSSCKGVPLAPDDPRDRRSRRSGRTAKPCWSLRPAQHLRAVLGGLAGAGTPLDPVRQGDRGRRPAC